MESVNVNFLEIFRSIPEGLISGGEIVFYIFLVGGAFGIIHKTGAFENGVNKAMRMLGKFPNDSIDDDNILILDWISRRNNYLCSDWHYNRSDDYGCNGYFRCASGFSGGMLNPFTVGVAQTVAELFSGWGLRTIIYLFILTAAISTVMLYARKVKKDKSKVLCMS